VDKKQLSQIRYLKSEIELLKKQIRDMDYQVTRDTVTGSDPDFPYTERRFTIVGIDYGGYERRTQRLKKRLEKRVTELIKLLEATHDYIENIDDSLIRQIITLRHIEGLTWEQVAARIGGSSTADSLRKMHDRFLKGA
jgi:hypothetical protein